MRISYDKNKTWFGAKEVIYNAFPKTKPISRFFVGPTQLQSFPGECGVDELAERGPVNEFAGGRVGKKEASPLHRGGTSQQELTVAADPPGRSVPDFVTGVIYLQECISILIYYFL